MGWQSTIDLTRKEANRLILQKLVHFDQVSDRELADMVESLGYVEDPDLEYYGHNFLVTDKHV